MTKSLNVIAMDLGAESGRSMLGKFDGTKLALFELHRFPNLSVRLPDGLHWDILYLFHEIKKGLLLGKNEAGDKLKSVGIDTWGVDFGLLDSQGSMLGLPYHYRDSRTDGMVEEVFRIVPRKTVFENTGIQIMQINSLFQLYAMARQSSPTLKYAATFLNIPDLLNYWLTGVKASEFTIASTTQCYDPRKNAWAVEMLDTLGIPSMIFPEIIQPGTILGKLHPAIAEETQCNDLQVVASAGHDTASAVAAVPAREKDFVYISSGTWSLMGVESPHPVINAKSEELNFTNEGGVNHTIRLLKNITGLWVVQECRRTWAARGEELSYAVLTDQAKAAPAFQSFIDPDHPDFMKPGNMPERIQEYCKRTNQPVPQTKGEIVRCALEGLALKYRWVFERLQDLVGHRLETIHIVGGGTQNQLLNQFAADSTGRTVITGPIEATAAGNMLVQLMALGEISSLAEARQVIRNSFDVQTYEPVNKERWDVYYQKFVKTITA